MLREIRINNGSPSFQTIKQLELQISCRISQNSKSKQVLTNPITQLPQNQKPASEHKEQRIVSQTQNHIELKKEVNKKYANEVTKRRKNNTPPVVVTSVVLP